MAPRTSSTKPHQFRNVTFTDHRPKFLANIDAALRGAKPEEDDTSRGSHRQIGETEVLDPNRPAIPVRPRDSDDEEPQVVSEEDRTGMGRVSDEEEERDEDSPLVVVVKEGRDLTKAEVEAEKIRLRDNPNAPSSLPTSSRATIKPSLSFSSNDKSCSSSKRTVDQLNSSDLKPKDGWSELVKRTKGDKSVMVSTIQEDREEAQKASASKKQKKLDLKAKNKKAKSLMSFS